MEDWDGPSEIPAANSSNGSSKWKILFFALVAVLILAGGFVLGRKTIKMPKPEVITEYITLPPVHDSIPKPEPYPVTVPVDTFNIIQQCIADGIYQELWPEKIDTQYVAMTSADTLKIVADWATKRHYSKVLFDTDTLGRFMISADVQYNRLDNLVYDYKPVQKNNTQTVYQAKAFSPFAGFNGAFATDGSRDFLVGVNGGAFINDKMGFQLSYQHSVYSTIGYVGGSFLYKF